VNFLSRTNYKRAKFGHMAASGPSADISKDTRLLSSRLSLPQRTTKPRCRADNPARRLWLWKHRAVYLRTGMSVVRGVVALVIITGQWVSAWTDLRNYCVCLYRLEDC